MVDVSRIDAEACTHPRWTDTLGRAMPCAHPACCQGVGPSPLFHVVLPPECIGVTWKDDHEPPTESMFKEAVYRRHRLTDLSQFFWVEEP